MNSNIGRKILKVVGILSAIATIILLILTIIVFVKPIPEIVNALKPSIEIDKSMSLEDYAKLSMVSYTIGQAVMTWLLLRASKNPKKSTFLLVLTTLSLISAIFTLFNKGVTANGIVSLIYNALLFVALTVVRKTAEEE